MRVLETDFGGRILLILAQGKFSVRQLQPSYVGPLHAPSLDLLLFSLLAVNLKEV